MIFVRDKGRMCNNILQYGHMYAWGREHGRRTMSMRFAYKYQYFHICETAYHNFPMYLMAKIGAKMGFFPIVDFDNPNIEKSKSEEFLLRYNNVIAEGWYARWYNLFLKYKQEIIDLFAFSDNIEQRIAPLLDEKLRLGVHIRRGDYATFQKGRFYYTDEQYIGIIRQFMNLHPQEQVHVYICGNDPKLNKHFFTLQLPDCQISFPQGNPGEDLCLLSHCHYLIGAPSTFSLVAAMYHDRPLYWIEDIGKPLSPHDFKHFAYLFQHIY